MAAYSDDDIVLVSAIEHMGYCPRQCALIHVEKVFDENVFTLRGTMAHERVDQPVDSLQDGVVVERALPIWSERYGLQGKADVVEFHPDGSIYPVEYKLDSRKFSPHAELQLCAQAICLEEMFDRSVPCGAVYSDTAKRRRIVELGPDIRRRTLAAVEDIRALLVAGVLPEAVNDSRCPNCSLINVCMPSIIEIRAGFDVFQPTNEAVAE